MLKSEIKPMRLACGMSHEQLARQCTKKGYYVSLDQVREIEEPGGLRIDPDLLNTIQDVLLEANEVEVVLVAPAA